MTTRHLDELRIEEARRELGVTRVRPGVARALAALWLVLVAAVPLAELAGPREPLPPRGEGPLHCALRALERRLDEDTRVARAVRPHVQSALLRAGAGNAQAYVGRGGWLFQREALTSVTAPSFQDPKVQRRRTLDADGCAPVPEPDPLAAVLAFAGALAERGVHLLVLPTPAKASAAPERFSARFDPGSPAPRNAGFAGFLAALRAEGVHVLDAAPLLRTGDGDPSYLATDTHWRPHAVEAVARGLARELEHAAELSAPTLALRRERETVTNRGDVAALLGARPDALPEERVEIRPVTAANGAPWRPDPRAEVLLLGDSFSNIYSDRAAFARDEGRLAWGAGAGLAEQLSFALQRPVDRLVRNDDGAFATRLDLARAAARAREEGRDRLGDLRAVVWQFAERELVFGDWRRVELPPPPDPDAGPTPDRPVPPAAAARSTVRATLAARSPLPEAGRTPYPEALFAAWLVDVEVLSGPPAPEELVVYVQGLRESRPTPAAGLRTGQRVTLELRPWGDAAVQERYGGLARTELDDDEALLLPAFFGEASE